MMKTVLLHLIEQVKRDLAAVREAKDADVFYGLVREFFRSHKQPTVLHGERAFFLGAEHSLQVTLDRLEALLWREERAEEVRAMEAMLMSREDR